MEQCSGKQRRGGTWPSTSPGEVAPSSEGRMPAASGIHTMGHELPLKFAYPEMFHLESLAMFSVDVMNKATVDIQLLEVEGKHKVEGGIIAALIDRNGLYNFRVGSLSVKHSKKRNNSEPPISLASSVVAVPCGWTLHIKVDLKIETGNKQRDWKETLIFNHDEGRLTVSFPTVVGHQPVLQVDINRRQPDGCQHSPPQLCRPVEDVRASNDSRDDLVYTIGDAMSFTEFIMALRRVLAEHPAPAKRDDILDGHKLLNFSSTRQHPLLAKMSAEKSSGWLHVKLQVVEEGRVTSWTTLLMLRNNLYVHGFMNQHGTYGLYKNPEKSVCLLPKPEGGPLRHLPFDVGYGSLLGATYTAADNSVHPDRPGVVRELTNAGLGKSSAGEAVRLLSSYNQENPNEVSEVSDILTRTGVGKALAGLIFMICESARTNPIHNSVARGWSDGTGFAEELMDRYVWGRFWASGSEQLQEWRKRTENYAKPDENILQLLQQIFLVLHVSRPRQRGGSGGGNGSASPTKVEAAGNGHAGDGHTKTPAPGGSSSQSGESGAPSSSDPPKEPVGDSKGRSIHDTSQGRGRPLVELLAIHADLPTPGTKIIVFDGKRGQIVYSKGTEEQGQQGMVDLLLTGPYTGISAEYGCFTIRIDVPGVAPMRLEWDCDVPKYADQVDKPPVTEPVGNENIAVATYAVMSNAREATVQVKLRFKDGQRPCGVVSGKITALIDGFQVPSVLFSRTEEATDECFSPTEDDSWYLLNLARSLVAVPCGEVLHIQVDLKIEASDDDNHVVTYLLKAPAPLNFNNNGIRSTQSHQDDGNQVEVEITWYPQVKIMPEPDVVYTIGDEVSFTQFIVDLRVFLADHPGKEYIFDRPVLAKQRAEQPARWLHVKLQVVEGKETYSATLIMRGDNLYVHGFMNQKGQVYELLDDNPDSDNMLPNNPRRLDWGLTYSSILGAKAFDILVTEGLGKSFAIKAVRRLSSSIHHPNDEVAGMMSARLALAGLIAMVCEPARMNPPRDALVRVWSRGTTGFTKQLMEDYVRIYGEMSRKLRAWNSRNFTEPYHFSELEATYLVLNTRLPRPGVDGVRPRPRVDLLAMRADLAVVGTTIAVFDGKRCQIIYRHKEQVEQGMVDLVLTGPYTDISAYGCFAIKIDIPAAAPIKWEWDCYDPKYAAQVNNPPVSQKIGNIAEVTYAVMSDALKATIQVKLRLNDGHSPGSVGGNITACIDDFRVGKVLFNHEKRRTDQSFSPTEDSMFLLRLATNVVAVPYSKVLHIKVDLEIEPSNNQGMKHFKPDLSIVNGILSKCHVVNGGEVEVDITWNPEPEKMLLSADDKHIREVVYTIGDDEMSYTGFIMALRRILANHPDREVILDQRQNTNLSTREHPVLTVLEKKWWLHIKLQVAGEETSTILAIGMHDLCIHAFMNHDQCHWYCLSNSRYRTESEVILPWRCGDMQLQQALGKTSAVNAVRVLSCFCKSTSGDQGSQFWPEFSEISRISPLLVTCATEKNTEDDVKEALAVLSVMVCLSAWINPVHDAIARSWNKGTAEVITQEQLQGYKENWERISTALREWKDSSYRTWKKDERLERIGIKSPEHALDVIRLCSAEWMYRF